MPEVTGIDHIYITVSDLVASERFYDRVMLQTLGFRKNGFVLGGDAHLQYYNRLFGFVLRPARVAARHEPYAPGLHHFCLRVDSIADVQDAAAQLQALGIAASPARCYPEYASDYWATFFEDPDGVRLEITNYRQERRERAERWEALAAPPPPQQPQPAPAVLLQAGALRLEPLSVAHAGPMFVLLSDPALYDYLDDEPPEDVGVLQERYQRWERGYSPDSQERWLTWILRPPGEDGAPGPVAGYVQASVLPDGLAWIGYVLGREFGGRGLARAAVAAALPHLQQAYGVSLVLATVEAENLRSIRLLEALGFVPAPPERPQAQHLSPSERLYELALPALRR